MLINWGQIVLINMVNKDSVLFRSTSSVSLLLFLHEILHYALHATIFDSLKSHMFDWAQYALFYCTTITTLFQLTTTRLRYHTTFTKLFLFTNELSHYVNYAALTQVAEK